MNPLILIGLFVLGVGVLETITGKKNETPKKPETPAATAATVDPVKNIHTPPTTPAA